MHEASLMESLLHQLNDLAIQHGGSHVTEVRVEVGPLAGVAPVLLMEAFQRQRGSSLSAEAELIIDSVGLTCRCRACQLKYVTEELRFVCPTCNSVDVDVIEGDAVMLHSVTITNSTEAATTQ